MKSNIPPLPSMKRGAGSGFNSNHSTGSAPLEEDSRKENDVPSAAAENKTTIPNAPDYNRRSTMPPSKQHNTKISTGSAPLEEDSRKENDVPSAAAETKTTIPNAPDYNRRSTMPPLKRHNTKISTNTSSPIVTDVIKRSRVKDVSPQQPKQVPLVGANANSIVGANANSIISSPSTTLTFSPAMNTNGGRVLRSGETIESFFCLPDDFTFHFSFPQNGVVDWSSHYELCKDIVQDINGAANDLNKWKHVVEVATHYVVQQSTEQNPLGDNLVRLLRRATTRFRSVENSSTSQSSSPLVDIWLLYARATALYSSRVDARSMFMDMKRKQLGTKTASFYIAYADFELEGCTCHAHSKEKQKGNCSCITTAKSIVDLGLQCQAEPLDQLRSYMGNLERQTILEASPIGSAYHHIHHITVDDTRSSRISETKSLKDRSEVSSTVSTSTLKHPIDPLRNSSQISSTNVFRPLQYVDRQLLLNSTDSVSSINNVKGTSSPSSSFIVDDKTLAIAPHQNHDKVEPIPGPNTKNESLFQTLQPVNDMTGTSSSSKVPLHFKRSLDRLRPAYRSQLGSPKRVQSSDDPDGEEKESNDQLGPPGRGLSSNYPDGEEKESNNQLGPPLLVQSSNDPDGEEKESNDDSVNHQMAPEQKPFSIAKLGYILNWAPSGPRPSSAPAQTTCLPGKEEPIHNRGFNSILGTIDEDASPEADSKLSSNVSDLATVDKKPSRQILEMNIQPPDTKLVGEGDRLVTDIQPSPQLVVQQTKLTSNSTPESVEVKSSASATLLDQTNPLFLPLVREDNIVYVNSRPYMKLSVIGKGGSCKVYRALSKDKAIVAIKKVNLSGMTKKAMEGYANEIALLRKLQGTPSIIQMYDSEVDAKRKAIYLVMEMGEIDLNHVLQQQQQIQVERSDGNPMYPSSLNMNFIRLTWQQMLSAVHSIHQERIIHGDLKPANFLFVKGALKLIDFGIAKAIQSDDTTNIYRDSQIGTLNYMSPESILDTGTGTNGGARMRCGKPSDVWSLGCILYQMCYGKTPFADLNMYQKLHAIVSPSHTISFPNTTDEAAVDAMKLCLRWKPEERASITGENGLLTEHRFLHS